MPYRARIPLTLILLCTPMAAHAVCDSGPLFSYYGGTGATANDYNSTALGYNAHADCESSVAVGTNATANGGIADIAIGHNASASAQYSTAIGNSSNASGMGSAAYGASANAAGLSSTAIGTGADASADYSTAIGQGSSAWATNSTAIGYLSTASAQGAVALGTGAQSGYQNSFALGYGASSTRADQIMLGSAGYTYTLAGIASASSSAAQTGSSVYMVTADEDGNLAVAAMPAGSSVAVVDDLTSGGTGAALSAEQGKVLDSRVTAAQGTADAAAVSAWSATVTANSAMGTAAGALQRSGGIMTGNLSMGGNRVTDVGAPVDANDAANKAYVDQQVGVLNDRVANVEQQARINTQGVAIAIALGGVSLPANKNVAVGANLGFFQDAQAFAAQGVFRVDDHVYFNTGVGMALGNASTTGGRVGLMAAW